jgi:hypothetical protein
LATIVALPALGVVLWCAILWQRLGRFGISPLLAGTALALAVHFGVSGLDAWTQYTAQAEAGALPMALRDSVVPGSALRQFLADLPFTLAWLLLGAGPAFALVMQGDAMLRFIALGLAAAVAAMVLVNPNLALVEHPLNVLAVGAAFLVGGWLALVVRRRWKRCVEYEKPS